MRKIVTAALFMTLMCAPALQAAEMPQLPKPVSQHKWLQRFVGTWESTAKIPGEPGRPPADMKSTENFSSIGGFWVVGRSTCKVMGQDFVSVLTIGYDTTKKKYVGSWIDSANSYMWKYEGSVDAKGTTLTLNTEGPNMMNGGKICKFREVTQFKGPDHRVFTSSVFQDGKWVEMMRVDSYRKKAKK